MKISLQLNPNEIASTLISPGDRVLITGATGWFGKTALDLLDAKGAELLLVGRKDQEVTVGGKAYFQNRWSLPLVNDFKPELVIDTAFSTREKISEMGVRKYIEQNEEILARSYQIARMDTVRTYLGFSSGAALDHASVVDKAEDPYGYLKREFELRMREISKTSSAVISIVRAWSVSGKYVTKPESFAFSNLIRQSHSTNINITAENAIWRRFCSLDELIAVGLAADKELKFNLINSGGTLVEIGELAKIICLATGRTPHIQRNTNPSLSPDLYHSDNQDWIQAVSRIGLRTKSLEDQILDVDRFLFPLAI
jgi:nucleoside-diphosphate-sugar epimerase